ncbi:MAG: HIT family protein [Patescibacteria group bacterium]
MSDCIFCKIVAGELPSFKVYEDDEFLAFLNIKPVNPGHVLVIPKKHSLDLLDMSEAEVSKFFSLVRKISPFVIQAVSAEGFNIGVNCGVTAGQTVFHAHVHIMPRQTGDGHGSWQGKDYKAGECEQVAEKIRSLMVV